MFLGLIEQLRMNLNFDVTNFDIINVNFVDIDNNFFLTL